MDKKLYALMDWPEIEDITYGESQNPYKLLGGHVVKDGFLIQVYRPDAVEIWANVSIKDKIYKLDKVDESGYFAGIIPTKRKIKYTLTIEKIDGKKEIFTDIYAFDRVLTEAKVKSIVVGSCSELTTVLGNHQMEINGVSGTHFAVWAPDANGVGVAGQFNDWNGKYAQMRNLDDSGVWEVFVPGVVDGMSYKFEIRGRSGKAVQKSDPLARRMEKPPFSSSVTGEVLKFAWTDEKWMSERAKSDNVCEPMSILELNMADMKDDEKFQSYEKLAEYVSTMVKDMHYTHVELMGVAEYLKEGGIGVQTTGFFTPTGRYGKPEGFAAFVDMLHKARIGVIMDLNLAFLPDDATGLVRFSGAKQYEMFETRIDRYPGIKLYTFDYTKPQVTNFLLESVRMWINEFHIDGFKVLDVSTMLYLDYGKNPGEWIPNIYGGNENFAAIEFLKKFNRIAAAENVFTIAQDESAWATVTGEPSESCLGFDFKWNENFASEMLIFMGTDPLFRNGEYGKFVNTMLYNYKENFILEMSHLHLLNQNPAELMAAPDEEAKKASLRLMYGYMFMHPGKKTIYSLNEKIDAAFDKYLTELNKFYVTSPALFEGDYEEYGFNWINDTDAGNTIVAFERCSAKGAKLLVVANFTPVQRDGYMLSVPDAGKYKEVFNSDKKAFGGSNVLNSEVCKSEEYRYNGFEEAISITLPPLGLLVFDYTPFTDVEIKEIQIKKEAKKAKAKAEEEARIAEELKLRAEREAAAAVEAEKTAKEAALVALTAKEDAEKKAKAALAASRKIDRETKKKLDELFGGKDK